MAQGKVSSPTLFYTVFIQILWSLDVVKVSHITYVRSSMFLGVRK